MELYIRGKYLRETRSFYDNADNIKVITGLRRCGKSSLTKMIRMELIDADIDASHIIYIDLELRKYRKIKTADQLEALIEDSICDAGLNYLFIDEIQNVKNFEEVINEFRKEGKCSIFITGSNSYLLSGELTTKLTGRYIEFEMYPLTFEEYEQMKEFYGIDIDSNPAITEHSGHLRRHIQCYRYRAYYYCSVILHCVIPIILTLFR